MDDRCRPPIPADSRRASGDRRVGGGARADHRSRARRGSSTGPPEAPPPAEASPPALATSRVLYDAGPLIAAERNDRRFWAEHRVRLESAIVPRVPAPIVAQVSRSPKKAQLRRLLRGCDVIPLDEAGAHRAGALLGRSGTADVADATLVTLAVRRMADIVTSDRAGIQRLASKTGARLRIVDT